MNFDIRISSPGFFDPTEIIDGIRQLYTTREGWIAPFPWCEEFHFHLDNIFTRLIMVSRKKTRGTATSNIVKMSAIFQPHEECPKPRTVLIEGKPGMGKTTYCSKVAYDWATKKTETVDYLPNVKVLLLLRCRDIDADHNVWEAIDDQLLDREIHEKERANFVEFIRHNQSKVLLVLDGLDELPASKLEYFSEIIEGRMLSGCRLVATARHETGIAVRKFCDTMLEIEGFTLGDAIDFISKFFVEKEGNLDLKLKDKLVRDRSLLELIANPLNTALLCLLCEDFQGVFPESRTHLYVEIVQCVLRRYRKKKGLAVNIEDLIELYKTQLKHLGKIALNGLCQDNMYFTDKQLENHTRDLPGFGFLSVQPGSSRRKPCTCYGFMHKSFQEFFAAYYLCCQLLSGEISPEALVADTSYFLQLRQVLLFTCGMLATQSAETAVALIKSIAIQVNEDQFAFALECIEECKREQSDFHLELARTFGLLLRLESILVTLTRDGYDQVVVLAEALKTNTTVTRLHLSHNKIDAAAAASLANALLTNTTLTVLVLSRNKLGAEGVAALANALQTNKTLTKLSLFKNNLDAAAAAALANALQTNTSLTVLDLTENNLGAEGVAALANALQTNTTLSELDLSRNNLGAEGVAALANALQTNTTLTVLNLPVNNFGADGVAALANALQTNTTLAMLDLSDNNLGAEGVAALANALQTKTNLPVLHLRGNNLGADGVAALANALQTNTTLRMLDLSDNNFGAEGVAALANALQTNKTLTKLSLFKNNLGAEGAAALANALQTNTALDMLGLSHNNLGADGVAALANVLQTNTTLTWLYLSHNNLGAEGAAALANALQTNTTLSELDLSHNNLDADGVAALANALETNTTLIFLHLRGNNLGADGVAALANALNINTTLSMLFLSESDFSQSVKEAHGDRIELQRFDFFPAPISMVF